MKTAVKNELLKTLKTRFEKNMGRHKGIEWSAVLTKLEGSTTSLDTLHAMEQTGGEPDVIGYDKKSDTFTFCDCSPDTPKDRRSLCFDRAALDSRKANKPRGSAMEMASELGIEMITEAQYRKLQELGDFDLKTSSWVATPAAVRKLGGALFCDRRFGMVFVYHNGAESYYAGRGFRGMINV